MLVNFSNKFVFDRKVNSGQIWDKIMQPFDDLVSEIFF